MANYPPQGISSDPRRWQVTNPLTFPLCVHFSHGDEGGGERQDLILQMNKM
jgi:hypothetical protein